MQEHVGITLNVLRTLAMDLAQRWHSRRIGDDVVRLFLAIETTVLARPRDELAALRAIRDLVLLLRPKAPTESPAIDRTVDAALALFGCLDPDFQPPPRQVRAG